MPTAKIENINTFSTGIQLDILREDSLFPDISGNKFRKLKYNIEAAKKQDKKQLISFGGAFSNHIAAVAKAGEKYDFQTFGIIRGEELASKPLNNTLQFATKKGMQLQFVSRKEYQERNSESYLKNLQNSFPEAYIIPEGGTNSLAIKGCEEILGEHTKPYDYIAIAVGTGGTISGLINSATPNQNILGFPALKGSFLRNILR